ncbi:hypothetical protein NP233_g9576 [Leucocoprinus birnbaumii]|uniref:Uncharacterized protein n=1 Tax=Leucocoprinus birnbaumii TaxID=56174 RepID=A0AAD5VKJ8_9AGAR|nr:hypothetical protein NP233_g9576 [Leucocoprinus birnbaumii]
MRFSTVFAAVALIFTSGAMAAPQGPELPAFCNDSTPCPSGYLCCGPFTTQGGHCQLSGLECPALPWTLILVVFLLQAPLSTMRRFTPPAGKSGVFGDRDSRDVENSKTSFGPRPQPLSFLPPSTNYLNTRRPSWTPSLPEHNSLDKDTLFMSSSYRPSRKRRVEDISSFSPLERNPNSSSPNNNFNFNFQTNGPGQGSVNLFRRASTTGGAALPPESVERPRKRIISADMFAEKENFRDLPEAPVEPASPEDGSNLRRSLQIDMKGLVGDAVGNMSISPSSRDIVLAARRGLFILDLESPLEVPRFLPQGGTWDVADVQWNPHPQRDRFIVSTSSEKLCVSDLHSIFGPY